MFGRLKKSLREGISRLSRKAEETEDKAKPKEAAKKEPKVGKPAEKKVRPKKVEKKPAETKEQAKEPAKEEKPLAIDGEDEEPEEPEQPEGPEPPEPEEVKSIKEEEPKQGRFRLGFRERISKRILTEKDIDSFFEEGEMELLQSDVALEVIDSLKEGLKKRLVDNPVKRGSTSDIVENAFRESLAEILDQGKVDIEKVIKDARKAGKPAVFLFLGFNGVGKTTAIAKLAHKLKRKGHRIVFSASDTFRSAAQEQLEVHGENLGIKVIKHDYGADPAAVLFDTIRYAKAKGCDVVMADTAGRTHTNMNLADELKKICRVNKTDLKILVLDSLTGNDIIAQGKMFNEMVGVDAVIMTKVDVDKKGGAIISAAFVLRKPILCISTGQEYGDIEDYSPKKIVNMLIG